MRRHYLYCFCAADPPPPRILAPPSWPPEAGKPPSTGVAEEGADAAAGGSDAEDADAGTEADVEAVGIEVADAPLARCAEDEMPEPVPFAPPSPRVPENFTGALRGPPSTA